MTARSLLASCSLLALPFAAAAAQSRAPAPGRRRRCSAAMPPISACTRCRACRGSAGSRGARATNGTVRSSPAVTRDRVYIGSSDGHLYALDRATGAVRWKYDAGGSVLSSPAVAQRTGALREAERHAGGARRGEGHAALVGQYRCLAAVPVGTRGLGLLHLLARDRRRPRDLRRRGRQRLRARCRRPERSAGATPRERSSARRPPWPRDTWWSAAPTATSTRSTSPTGSCAGGVRPRAPRSTPRRKDSTGRRSRARPRSPAARCTSAPATRISTRSTCRPASGSGAPGSPRPGW